MTGDRMVESSESERVDDAPQPNSRLSKMAQSLVRLFEALGIRGAPTILSYLWRIARVRREVAVVPLGQHQIAFPAFDAYWARHLWVNVPYEPELEQIFRRIAKDKVLIDCGANLGFWSILASDFGFVSVVAIEANRELMPYLAENFRLNRIPGEALHAAVYSTSGEQLFLGSTEAHATATISDHGLPVTSVTIADICRRYPQGTRFVAKLDVEGAEIAALDGAAGFLDDIIVIYEDFAQNGMNVTKDVLGRGMSVFGVSASGRSQPIRSGEEAAAFNKANSRPRGPSNLVACSGSRAAEVEQLLLA